MKIASLAGRRLEVRTSAGSVVFRATAPRLIRGVFWISPTRVGVGDRFGARAFDLRTGRSARFAAASFGLNTTGSGTNWAARDGTRVYAHVTGCNDDGGPGAAIASLQRVPHSTSLVYQSHCAEPFDNLYSIAPDGSRLRRVTNDYAQETTPQLSPDHRQLVYGWAEATGLSCKGCATSVRTLRLDGSGGATLTTPPDCTFDDSPSWSPDGTQIAYSNSSCSIAPQLMTMPSAGGAPHGLKVEASQAAWGPKLIAYLDGGTIPSSIWTVRPDGTGATKVGAGDVFSPSWSPDGRLAYLDSANGTTATIATGTTKTHVKLPFRRVATIAWSPDGTHFVLAARAWTDASFDLYVVKTDGTDVQRLTSNLDVSSADWG